MRTEYVTERPTCDREVGTTTAGWHACGRPAQVFSDREISGGHYRLYYCARHAQHAHKAESRSVRVETVGAVVLER